MFEGRVAFLAAHYIKPEGDSIRALLTVRDRAMKSVKIVGEEYQKLLMRASAYRAIDQETAVANYIDNLPAHIVKALSAADRRGSLRDVMLNAEARDNLFRVVRGASF